MLASGCGNAVVGDQGIVNIRCNGTPNFSAQWIWPKLGGFAMIASAINGLLPRPPTPLKSGVYDVPSPGSIPVSMSVSFRWRITEVVVDEWSYLQALQPPRSISHIPFLRLLTSPLLKLSKPGIKPGFLTMNAIYSKLVTIYSS